MISQRFALFVPFTRMELATGLFQVGDCQVQVTLGRGRAEVRDGLWILSIPGGTV